MEPRTDWKEEVAPDEAVRNAEYASTMTAIQKARDRDQSPGRVLHYKPHVGVRARFVILPDLPPPCRVGIFASPGEYPAWARFSNGSARRQSDHAGDVRGLAFKVLGVPGRKLIPAMEGATTQDFLLIQTPTFGFRDGHEFMFFVGASRKPALLLPRLVGHLGFGRAFQLISGLARTTGRRIESLALERFWTPVPVRWGDHAAKYSLLPRANGAAGPRSANPDYLGEELVARLARGPIEYDFAVQLYSDERKTPIEDASVEWRERDAPFVTVGRLVIPRQDLASAAGARQRDYVERLSFDPWHAPVEFRPLGHVMRVRAETYRVSVEGRAAAPEPTAVEVFDEDPVGSATTAG